MLILAANSLQIGRHLKSDPQTPDAGFELNLHLYDAHTSIGMCIMHTDACA